MASCMMTVRCAGGAPDLSEAAGRLGVAAEKLDADFGVVAVDPDRGVYAVLLCDAADAPSTPAEDVEGPFSNPGVAPYGPPER